MDELVWSNCFMLVPQPTWLQCVHDVAWMTLGGAGGRQDGVMSCLWSLLDGLETAWPRRCSFQPQSTKTLPWKSAC